MNQAKEDINYIEQDNKKELKQELTELIKAIKVPENLPSCVEDAFNMQNFFTAKLGVLPENQIVMATEEDVSSIIQEIYVEGVSTPGDGARFFPDEMKDDQKYEYFKESDKVPTDYLSAIKFQYNVFGREFTDLQEEKFSSLRDIAKPGTVVEPSNDEFLRTVKRFEKEANDHPELNYLFAMSFSSQGYTYGGMQSVAAPFYDAEFNQVSLIEVEKIIRELNVPNAFFWVQFGCSREIKMQEHFRIPACLSDGARQPQGLSSENTEGTDTSVVAYEIREENSVQQDEMPHEEIKIEEGKSEVK